MGAGPSNEMGDENFELDSIMNIEGKLYYRSPDYQLYKVVADDLDGKTKQRWKLVEPEDYDDLRSQPYTRTKENWVSALENNEYPISLVPFEQSEEEINNKMQEWSKLKNKRANPYDYYKSGMIPPGNDQPTGNVQTPMPGGGLRRSKRKKSKRRKSKKRKKSKRKKSKRKKSKRSRRIRRR